MKHGLLQFYKENLQRKSTKFEFCTPVGELEGNELNFSDELLIATLRYGEIKSPIEGAVV